MISVLGCRILVKPYKLQEHDKVYAAAKAAGIQLPEFAERKEQVNVDKGTVLEIGATAHSAYTGGALVVGDVIGFAKFGGKYIQDPETEEVLLVINDEDVVCVFKDTK